MYSDNALCAVPTEPGLTPSAAPAVPGRFISGQARPPRPTPRPSPLSAKTLSAVFPLPRPLPATLLPLPEQGADAGRLEMGAASGYTSNYRFVRNKSKNR